MDLIGIYMYCYRAIKDSRKIHNEDSKLNEKPKRVPSWKRHLIEKKKNKGGRMVVCYVHSFIYMHVRYTCALGHDFPQ